MTELIIASLLEYQLIFDIVRVSVECYTSVKVCKFVLTNIKAVYKHIWHTLYIKDIYIYIYIYMYVYYIVGRRRCKITSLGT